jgi:tetratricopeptide (TPR) repeat protein
LADSLWLAGFREGAVEIWTALVSPGDTPQDLLVRTDLLVRSLYNLASVSTDEQLRVAYYEKLLSQTQGHTDLAVRIYGIIGYSRLLDTVRAEGILAEAGTGEPLLDLELLRRRSEAWELKRTVAETWLLLGRHPREEGLYRWGAWYFDRQRQFPETALLLRQARINGIDSPALVFHEVFRLIREAKLLEAEALLREASLSPKAYPAVWQVPANLGLIAESRRALSPALEYYESAYILIKDRHDAAKVQLRIARCLHMLGRDEESRRALETVLELEPENLNARMELRRLGY